MKITHDIIERIYKRERRSCKLLYDKYQKVCFGICLRYARNRSDAQDMLQEGFLEVFKSIKTYSFSGSFEGWIKRVMFYQVVNYIRKHYKNPLEDNITEQIISTSNEDSLQVENLLEVIHSIPEKYRIIFNLYAVENYSHKEIAEMMSIKESSSRSLLLRARKMIMHKLKQIEIFENKLLDHGS